MQSRYFTPAISFLVALCAAHPAMGQEPPSSKGKVGYIRFWNMLPPTSGTYDLRQTGGNPSEANLFAKVPAYRYSSYRDFPPARYNLAVYKTSDDKAPLKTFSVELRPNSYFTVLVSPEGGVVNIQLLDDANDPKTPGATLIIRNYFPGLTVDVSSAEQPIVAALPYGRSYVAGNLPLKRLPIKLRSRLPNGAPTESEAEADFIASKRGTLLIIPDSYGRFRPRATIDGKNL